jgi:hypothetical protein
LSEFPERDNSEMSDISALVALLLSQMAGQTGDGPLTPAALQNMEIRLREIREDVQHAAVQRPIVHESPEGDIQSISRLKETGPNVQSSMEIREKSSTFQFERIVQQFA